MNKRVTVREFLRRFSELEKGMAPGARFRVTRRGSVIGKFIKEPRLARRQLPNFQKDASRPGFDTKAGDQLLARMLREENFS